MSWRIAVSTKSKSGERAERRKWLVSPRTGVAVVFHACKCCNTLMLLPPQCYQYYFHGSTRLCLRRFECRIGACIVKGLLPSYLCCSSVQWEKLVLVGMIWNPGEEDQKNPTEHRGSKNVLGLNRKGVGKHCFHLARHLISVTDREARVEILVEVTAAADTCLVFGNELSAILNIDLANSLSALNC